MALWGDKQQQPGGGKGLRADITGLRAIAVAAVTIYHLVHVLLPEVTYFKGGFLGVDIFFVISGFLMTMIIMKGLEKGSFSLVDFYRRRAKRICPALLVTVVIFVGLGMLLIGTSDLKKMGAEGFYALLFVSNIYFAAKTDYFGNSALDLAFLHTWSLSVEWQFYLFFPLIVMALRKVLGGNRELLARTILILTIALSAFAAWYTAYNPRASYYLLPSRAFELLFGSLAYFYPLSWFKEKAQRVLDAFNASKHKTAIVADSVTAMERAVPSGFKLFLARTALKITPMTLEAVGIVVILQALVWVDDSAGWPTMVAVIPLFGTYLCIAADNKKSLLSNVVFQKLGLWSYAIYLAHWPLLVLITKLGFNVWCLELLLPILLLGIFLHYAVERRRNFGYLFLCCYLIMAGGAFYINATGASFRLQQDVTRYAQYGGHSVPFDGTINEIGDVENRRPDFILIGDSFARHYALDLIDRGLHVITVFRDGCYSFAHHVNRRTEGYVDDKCALRYHYAREAVNRYPELPVVVAQDWPRYRMSLVSRILTDQSFSKNAAADAVPAADALEPEMPGALTGQTEAVPEPVTGAEIETQAVTSTVIKAVPESEFEEAVAADLRAMAEDFSTGQNKVYVLGTPRQTVYDIGSTCMYLKALDNPLSRFLGSHITCIKSKQLNAVPLNDFILNTVEKLPQNEGTDERTAKIRYIDPNDAICIDGECEILVGRFIPVYQDGLHYSWAGSVKVVSFILSQIGVEQGRIRLEFEDEVLPEDAAQ